MNGGQVSKSVLDNGLVVVSEEMNQVRSVSFGLFLRTGSRYETLDQHGLTHFIEHALFKGTERRSAAQIAAEADQFGGNLDAFTGREIVGFHDKVLDEHLPSAFDLIADLIAAPAFDPSELEKERNVILEELKMVEDTPDDIIFDIFAEKFYPGDGLGRPIIGTRESIITFSAEAAWPYYRKIFTPENMVLAAAGNMNHRQLAELAEQHFGGLARTNFSALTDGVTPEAVPAITLSHKEELEQSHLLMGVPCVSAVSDDRYVCHLLSVILGGGMSSRLFQSVREERGLVYTIYAAVNPFFDCGNLNIYAATSAERMTETIEATLNEIRRLRQHQIGEPELRRNKEQLKASLMLNLESTSSRMSSLAHSEMTFGRNMTPEEVIDAVEAVTVEDLQRMANDIFGQDRLAVTVLGDLDGFSLQRSDLEC
ncbi:MAG: insulinase family protein [Acidobacteria bacterium]|nr:insulinase family protein [Acidobacteriota bacterium]